MQKPDFEDMLRSGGYKATPGRVLLLKTLFSEDMPVGVSYLEKKLTHALDKVTLYRALQSMVRSGLVREIDFRHGHVHYELDALRKHHHHVVCTVCGKVEDAECVVTPQLKKKSSFKNITDHAVEFFGICNACA